jgi:hypothetical protein
MVDFDNECFDCTLCSGTPTFAVNVDGCIPDTDGHVGCLNTEILAPTSPSLSTVAPATTPSDNDSHGGILA